MSKLQFLLSKPTCLKQLPQGKIENDIIKFKNIFDVTYICRIYNLKDSLEKFHGDGVTIKIQHRCCITSTRLTPHLFLLGWLKLNLILLLDQLILA